MRAVRPLLSSHSAPELDSLKSEVAAFRSDAENVVEVPFDDNTTGKKVAVRDFDPQIHRGEDVWLTIFQIVDAKNLLHAVFQTHED